MHELSLCHQISTVVTKAAAGRQVETVHLQVGRLRQVVPDTLVYCWEIVTDTTELAGSVLDIESIPITVSCGDCAHVTQVEHDLILTCASCNSGNVSVTTGEEFLITSLELKKEPDHGSIPSPR